MPALIKPWLKYPPNTSTPINDVSMKALEARTQNYVGAENIGPGVNGFADFQVTQTGVASMVLNVGTANVLNAAFIAWDANGSTSRYEYNGSQLTVNVPTADPTNPRIDRVILTPTGIDSQTATPSILPGTPTAGATVLNLTGAAAVPVGSILLANVLVAAAATSIANAAISDARVVPFSSSTSVLSPIDQVAFMPAPGLVTVNTAAIAAVHNNNQYAARMTLNRRIVGATRFRWKYTIGPTTLTGNYNIAIYDDAGRIVAVTGVTAINGTINTTNIKSDPLISATTFEAGNYIVAIGLASLASGGNAAFSGVVVAQSAGATGNSPNTTGLAFNSASAGIALPNLIQVPALMIDVGGSPSNMTAGNVPLGALSVG